VIRSIATPRAKHQLVPDRPLSQRLRVGQGALDA